MPPIGGATAPHAALLIDFDNVTLGIRSDLTKELRSLLNSDIIKGKVAVQRAYADWRRYPQYIVPLSEASIDLIFAPAFGSNKKNATDIRLAVDAIELVFTRPEIGTIILLSGDSDFSSLVIKLKEYGKYVIGVGMRESASDLLIQNCDEYYSYSDLAGLTREADRPSVQRDPWDLVVEAAQMMERNRDVMRSDRLKQVMQQIDPNFDEKNAGFNRFSKFVSEAAQRGLLRVTKLDNGQFEVIRGPGAPGAPPDAERAEPRAEEAPGGGRRRGRGRRGGGGGGSAAPREGAAVREDGTGAERHRPARAAAAPDQLTLAAAFHLLTRALGDLPAPVPQDTLRQHMLSLHGREDPLISVERFGRFLRQANDAEVADVRRAADDRFEVSPHRTDLALARSARTAQPPAAASAAATSPAADRTTQAAPTAPAPTAPAGRPALRFRRGSRVGVRSAADVPLVGVVTPAAATTAVPAEDAKPAGRGRARAPKEGKAKAAPTARKNATSSGRRTRKKAVKAPDAAMEG